MNSFGKVEGPRCEKRWVIGPPTESPSRKVVMDRERLPEGMAAL